MHERRITFKILFIEFTFDPDSKLCYRRVYFSEVKMCNVKSLYQRVRYRIDEPFLGAFSEFGKATISFVMSARPYGTTRFPLNIFS